MVLHADERAPTVLPREMQGLAELPGVHGGGAEVAHLAALDEVVQRLEGLLDGGRIVPAMNLIQIDVVGAEPAQAGVDGSENGFTGQAAAVRSLEHRDEYLGGDDHGFALRKILQGAADDLLGGAVGISIGGIEEVDAGLRGLAKQGTGLVLGQRP